VELRIAGEGDLHAALEGLVERRGLRDRVNLIGYQDDIIPFLAGLDVFVVSSLREGLPNVLLEAMALQLPVLSTKVAGVAELVRDGENGLLVESGSVVTLTDALRRLHNDPLLRERLASEARRTVEASFSFAERMRKVVEVYEACLANGRSGLARKP
jgi:glycosyltransferase involved in cell wall biosynthesis